MNKSMKWKHSFNYRLYFKSSSFQLENKQITLKNNDEFVSIKKK